jgi:hypothetical protein
MLRHDIRSGGSASVIYPHGPIFSTSFYSRVWMPNRRGGNFSVLGTAPIIAVSHSYQEFHREAKFTGGAVIAEERAVTSRRFPLFVSVCSFDIDERDTNM